MNSAVHSNGHGPNEVNTSMIDSDCNRKCSPNSKVELNSVLDQILSRSGVQDKVHIKDVTKTKKLIEELISGGPVALQVITDFDATLSCYHSGGQKCKTSYGVITSSRLIPKDVFARGAELYNYYYAIEIDPNMDPEEKAAHMTEWYDKKHRNMLSPGVKIKASDIADLAKEAHLVLRPKSDEVLNKLNAADIPTLVFSAGSGNAVEEVLKLNQICFPNVKIIANFMEFDEETKLAIGFSKPIVHPGNKNEAAIHETHSEYFEKLRSRRNVILLGDMIGDTSMATGLPDPNAILKIGFLNFNVEEQLDHFKEAFDIVLADDQSMNLVNALLDTVLQKST